MYLRLWNVIFPRLNKTPLLYYSRSRHNTSEIKYYNSAMNSNTKRGALLAFEGLDRSGKSTQSLLLVKSLQDTGKTAQLLVFPDRTTPIGKIIDQYLSNKSYDLNDNALHLLFVANRFESMNKMKDLLLSGVNVVVDRYSYSGIVFSGAKQGMDINWCKFPESGLPAPDAVFFLNLPFKEMKKRPGFGEERYENLAFQTEVLKEYEKLADEHNFINVDAKDTKDNIQNVILKHTLQVIQKVEHTDLQYLDFIYKNKNYEKQEINGKALSS